MFIHYQIVKKDPRAFLLHKPRNLFEFNIDDYEYQARYIIFEKGGGETHPKRFIKKEKKSIIYKLY